MWEVLGVLAAGIVAVAGGLVAGEAYMAALRRTPACGHVDEVAIESAVPGVGVVAYWCPTCNAHSPDPLRRRLPKPPTGPGASSPRGVTSVTRDGVTTTYGSRREAVRSAEAGDVVEVRTASGALVRTVRVPR